MKRVEAPCPSCGGEVEFKISSSYVTVCEYCQTVVARGDRKIEDFGKVAAIAPTGTRLNIGDTGVYRGKSFEIVGHVQYQHAGGGVWDEWFATFPGDRWAWFSEAQGKIYFLRHRKLKGDSKLPTYDSVTLGETLDVAGGERLTVSELGTATVGGAEGELPFALVPGASHRYVDLVGTERAFATIEYDTPQGTVLNLGREVTLADLDLAPASGAIDAELLEIGSIKVDCPNCGGSLDLHAPDQAERVICPFCEGVLDASHGKLKYLHTAQVRRHFRPVIPIGSTGHLDHDYVVIGFMQRSVTYDKDYFWTEYLLYNQEHGFRWLVHSDDHWSFVEPISLAEIRELGVFKVEHNDQTYRMFQNAQATVTYVLGEFYWKVAVGEKVNAKDFICPPRMISVERTILGRQSENKESAEITVSLGTYIKHEEIERAFNVKNLRRGWGVAPNQPNKVKVLPLWINWGIFVAALAFINFVAILGLNFAPPDGEWFWFSLVMITLFPAFATYARHNVEVQRWKDSEYNPYGNG